MPSNPNLNDYTGFSSSSGKVQNFSFGYWIVKDVGSGKKFKCVTKNCNLIFNLQCYMQWWSIIYWYNNIIIYK